ncbi:MAG: aspartate kinase [Flavobacteriales bacterium]|nr:aspartate kinase [Flavobacteriales bacterium]|tara:strand:- start:145 stop:1401 length:1257 start_codon:yes stop_codon:yes gene_type:complete
MKIYKFGGASIKDSDGVKNLLSILNIKKIEKTLLVVSAMGKTTNNFEQVVDNYFNNKNNLDFSLKVVYDYHHQILENLFENTNHNIFREIKLIFRNIKEFLDKNKSPNFSFVYDQVVSNGELISSKIICEFLNNNGVSINWIDAREIIKTDSKFRGANVNWKETKSKISKNIDINQLNITQGFIGSDNNNFTSTLGREGSDYSAAIIAFCLNAKSLTIWKDVPGVLNCDPKVFKNPVLLENISYSEAIELAFYGASVIHPKTLQPLQKKEIPLLVKSFYDPNSNGTKITRGIKINPKVPCFIVKNNLSLIKLSSLDFSFIVEENISVIFQELHDNKIKVDLTQNSAISIYLCIEDKYSQLDNLISKLKAKFKVKCIENVDLFTIRHFDKDSSKRVLRNHNLILEQRTNEVLKLVVKKI